MKRHRAVQLLFILLIVVALNFGNQIAPTPDYEELELTLEILWFFPWCGRGCRQKWSAKHTRPAFFFENLFCMLSLCLCARLLAYAINALTMSIFTADMNNHMFLNSIICLDSYLDCWDVHYTVTSI